MKSFFTNKARERGEDRKRRHVRGKRLIRFSFFNIVLTLESSLDVKTMNSTAVALSLSCSFAEPSKQSELALF